MNPSPRILIVDDDPHIRELLSHYLQGFAMQCDEVGDGRAMLAALAAVPHDLRTPLTRIKLRSEQLDDPALKARLGDDIADMAAMLDATLSYLRDDASTEAWQWLDMHALLAAMSEDAEEQGRPVTLHGDAGPLYTLPASLCRCLDNLLENALRYGERAEIMLCDTAEWLSIEIRDHGPGIPENRMEAVFEPFVRLEESRNRHSGGVGLGLAIARDEDSGLSQDQLSQMASDASAAGDTTAASRFGNLAASFEEADSDGDGKVSFAESIAFEKAAQSSSDSSASSNTSSSDSSTSVDSNSDARIMMQLMQLMRSYGLGSGDGSQQQSNLLGLRSDPPPLANGTAGLTTGRRTPHRLAEAPH